MRRLLILLLLNGHFGESNSTELVRLGEISNKNIDKMLNSALNITDRQNFVFNSSFSSSSTFCFSPTGEKGKCKPISLCPTYHAIVNDFNTTTIRTFFRERICRLLHTSVLICCPLVNLTLPLESRSYQQLPQPLPKSTFPSQPNVEVERQPILMVTLQSETKTEMEAQQPQMHLHGPPQHQQKSTTEMQEQLQPLNHLMFQPESRFLHLSQNHQVANASMYNNQSSSKDHLQDRLQNVLPDQLDIHKQSQGMQQQSSRFHPQEEQSAYNIKLRPRFSTEDQSMLQSQQHVHHAQLLSHSNPDNLDNAPTTDFPLPNNFPWLQWSTRLLELFLLICLIAFLLACVFIALFFLFFRDLFMLVASSPYVSNALPMKK